MAIGLSRRDGVATAFGMGAGAICFAGIALAGRRSAAIIAAPSARMCAEGAGLAVLPCPLGDATPGIRRIDLGEAPPGRDVWLGYHRDLRRVARLRALLDATIDALANV